MAGAETTILPTPISTSLNFTAFVKREGVTRRTIQRRLKNRWRPPVAPASSSATKAATHGGPPCRTTHHGNRVTVMRSRSLHLLRHRIGRCVGLLRYHWHVGLRLLQSRS